MKHFVILFLILLCYCHSPGQTDSLEPSQRELALITRTLDSLPYFIQTGLTTLPKNPVCKIPEHTNYFIPHNQYSFSQNALQLKGVKKQKYILLIGYRERLTKFYNNKDYENSKKCLMKALEIETRYDFLSEELHGTRMGLNNIFFLTGDFSSAMKISTEGLIKAERIHDYERMAHYNNVLGCVMLKLKNFENAGKYFSEELRLGKQIGSQITEVHAYMNLADLAIAENKNKNAISNINNALLIYYDRQPLEFNKITYAHNKLSEVYKRMNQNDSSLKYALLTVDYIEKNDGNNEYDMANYYINTGDIYNRLKMADTALFYLRKGFKMADSIKHREYRRDVYEQLAISYSLKKRFDSAFAFQQMFSSLKDSILNENSERDILSKEADLKVEREKRIQEAELSRQRFWRNITIAGLAFAILITIMLYNRRRIKQKMIYQQQLNKQQNEMMNAIISTQDQERKRIAEDLHDSLGSILSAAKLKLSGLEGTVSSNGNGQAKDFDDTMNLLDEAVNEMRNISHNLLPASLLRLGLVAGLQNLFDKISAKSGLQVSFNTHGFNERLDESTEVSIYRIILEAVNNVIKHAKAKNVTVQLMQYENYINILVEDDGIGFKRQNNLQGHGIGLNNIFSRVDHMKGKIDIDTKPKVGTVINVDIPYKRKSG